MDNAELQRDFFNAKAPHWRTCAAREKVMPLLEPMGLRRGERALDVGCGTGVLTEYLLSFGLEPEGIDVSDEMIRRAREAHGEARFFVADFYRFAGSGVYDRIFVFDAYPHFTDKAGFEERAYALLKEGGVLHIFFDESRAEINSRHSGHDGRISAGLKSAEEEAKIFARRFETVSMRDDESYFSLGLRKKAENV